MTNTKKLMCAPNYLELGKTPSGVQIVALTPWGPAIECIEWAPGFLIFAYEAREGQFNHNGQSAGPIWLSPERVRMLPDFLIEGSKDRQQGWFNDPYDIDFPILAFHEISMSDMKRNGIDARTAVMVLNDARRNILKGYPEMGRRFLEWDRRRENPSPSLESMKHLQPEFLLKAAAEQRKLDKAPDTATPRDAQGKRGYFSKLFFGD